MQIGPVKIKVQLLCGSEAALGPGKASLLDAIDREGSISAAGRALGMSYRRAWLLVDSMNRCWIDRLVETTAGGSPRRGARLTAKGRLVLNAYRAFEQQLERAGVGDVLHDLTDGLRQSPLPARAVDAAIEPEA